MTKREELVKRETFETVTKREELVKRETFETVTKTEELVWTVIAYVTGERNLYEKQREQINKEFSCDIFRRGIKDSLLRCMWRHSTISVN